MAPVKSPSRLAYCLRRTFWQGRFPLSRIMRRRTSTTRHPACLAQKPHKGRLARGDQARCLSARGGRLRCSQILKLGPGRPCIGLVSPCSASPAALGEPGRTAACDDAQDRGRNDQGEQRHRGGYGRRGRIEGVERHCDKVPVGHRECDKDQAQRNDNEAR